MALLPAPSIEPTKRKQRATLHLERPAGTGRKFRRLSLGVHRRPEEPTTATHEPGVQFPRTLLHSTPPQSGLDLLLAGRQSRTCRSTRRRTSLSFSCRLPDAFAFVASDSGGATRSTSRFNHPDIPLAAGVRSPQPRDQGLGSDRLELHAGFFATEPGRQ